MERIPELMKKLREVVAELECLFPGRKFTMDGHLVGSVGEVMAAYRYDVELLRPSYPGHDARDSMGRLVQIKATQGRRVALRNEPAYLIVLQLVESGEAREVYNGPGAHAWRAAGKMQSNGQRPISLARLSELAVQIPPEERIGEREPQPPH